MNLEDSSINFTSIEQNDSTYNVTFKEKIKTCFMLNKLNIIKFLSKIFYYFLHLTLIAMFETIFYFFYISGQEDSGINDNVLTLTKQLSYNCKYLPYNIRNYTIEFLMNYNETDYIISHENRIDENNILFGNAMNYVYSFVAITLFIGIILFYFKEGRNKCKELIIDTLVIISILTIYEYNFFLHIIRKYSAITTDELEYFSRNELLYGCLYDN